MSGSRDEYISGPRQAFLAVINVARLASGRGAGFRVLPELWPRASARATQARTSFLPARPHPAGFSGSLRALQTSRSRHTGSENPVFLSLHPQMQKDPSPTPTACELCFGPKAEGKKSRNRRLRRGWPVQPFPGRAGGVCSGRCPWPCLPGARLQRPASKVPANVTHRSVLSVPAERAWSAP